MDKAAREAALKAIKAGYEPEKYEQQLIDFPAWGNTALATRAFRVDWQPDWDDADGESHIAGVYPEVTFLPGTVECRVCGLVLDPEDAIQAAGVPESWELADVDAEDFYEHLYESDDDR